MENVSSSLAVLAEKKTEQAGAELCQAQLSWKLLFKLKSKLAVKVANDMIIQIQEMH